MKRSTWISLLMISICIVWAVSRPCMGAEQFPTKPIELWVGYGAGGSTDIPARALADAASKALGQPVVVVNKPGGGSAVMMGELKTRKADGYTLGVLSSGGVLSA